MNVRKVIFGIACLALMVSTANAATLTSKNIDKTNDYAMNHDMRVLVVSTDSDFSTENCQIYAAEMTKDEQWLHLYDVSNGYDYYKNGNVFGKHYFHVFKNGNLPDLLKNNCWKFDNVDELVGA